MAIQIPIASLTEPNLLQVDTVYQVTDLTASKSYDFVVTEPTGKFIHLVIAQEEALTTVIYEHEPVNGTVLDFATPAGVTSVFLKVTAVSGATPYLTMAASKAVTDTALVVPAVPETWYKVTSLTEGDVYEVKVSSEVPVTIQSGFGASFDLNALQYNPPQTLQTGSFLVTATAANMWLYVDGADPANISVTKAVPVVGFQPVTISAISSTGGTITVPAGSPAGIYRVDFVANDPTDATTYDAKIVFDLVPLLANAVGSLSTTGLGPVKPGADSKTLTGNNLRGCGIVRVASAPQTPLPVAAYTAPTTGTASQISGQFALTYIGNLSA